MYSKNLTALWKGILACGISSHIKTFDAVFTTLPGHRPSKFSYFYHFFLDRRKGNPFLFKKKKEKGGAADCVSFFSKYYVWLSTLCAGNLYWENVFERISCQKMMSFKPQNKLSLGSDDMQKST